MSWVNDFYAAIIAVGGVTIITKFVTHRSRGKGPPHQAGVGTVRPGFWLHLICVVLSLSAILFALIGLGFEIEWGPFKIITGGLLVLALATMVFDGLWEDSRDRAKEGPSRSVNWLRR